MIGLVSAWTTQAANALLRVPANGAFSSFQRDHSIFELLFPLLCATQRIPDSQPKLIWHANTRAMSSCTRSLSEARASGGCIVGLVQQEEVPVCKYKL